MNTAQPQPRVVEKRGHEFRVPVRRHLVALTLGDGSLHEGTIFRDPTEETDLFLESERAFLPVDEGGTIKLYSRRAIAAVTVLADGASEVESLLVRVNVVVRFRGGGTLRGELRFVPERSNVRSLDYLNEGTKSFALHEGARVHHVAKEHVESVEEK